MDSQFDPYKRSSFQRPPLPDFLQSQDVDMSDNPIPMSELEAGPSHGDFNLYRAMKTINFGQSSVNWDCFEEHACKIVAKLERDEELMEDTPVSEQLRKEALRDLPQCMTIKRCVKAKLSKSVSQKSKRRPISWRKSLKYRMSLAFSKFKANLKNFGYFRLWHGTLKNIEGHFGSGYASYFRFFRWLFIMNWLVALPSFFLLVVPQIWHDVVERNSTEKGPFYVKDIFTGGGYFRDTVFYYGHYVNGTISFGFNMPAAYFSVMLILYLFSLLVLSISVAESYRRSFIETEGGLKNVFAHKIFCGWDYGIATRRGAELKSSAIYNELKELLSESLKTSTKRPLIYRFWTWTIQVVVNVIILILLAGIGYVLWLLLDKFGVEQGDTVFITTVAINLVMMVFPAIFSLVSKHEGYQNPRVALYITLIRTFLLGLVVVGVVVAFWLSKADVTECWETRLGEEIYRLIIFDFIFSVVLMTLAEICWFIVQRLQGQEGPTSEFDIARHTLQAIYNQGLFWVGFLFSPLLPAVVVIKMFIVWYVRDLSVRKLCKPPTKTWRAAQTNTYFLMMTFVTILLVISLHGYALTSIKSSSCGPFRAYSYVYEIVTGGVTDLRNSHIVWRVLMYLTKPWVVALIMVAFGIWVYYLKEKSQAQREKVRILREMLVWEAKDKEYLLRCIENQTNGQFKYRQQGRSLDAILSLPESFNRSSRSTSLRSFKMEGDEDEDKKSS